MLSLRVELKTSRLLNGCSNQLSYESFCWHGVGFYLNNVCISVKRPLSDSDRRDLGPNCDVNGHCVCSWLIMLSV